MKKLPLALCIAASLCAGAGSVHAQYSLSVTGELEHIENPLLSSTSPGAATVLRVTPTYAYEARGDRWRSRFSAGAVLERSSDTALVANRNYPNVGYTWEYSWPTASLGLRANLAESATRITELEEFGRVTVDSRERSLATGARWEQELTASTRMALDVANSRISYDSPLLADYRELVASSRFSWEATERVAYFVEPGYSRLTPAGPGPSSTRVRWVTGVTGALAERWTLTAFVGQARTRVVQTATNSVGGVQLAYLGSRFSSSADWSRDVTASGLTPGYARTESLLVRVGYRITEDAAVSASMARSQSGGAMGSRGLISNLSLENELGASWSSRVGVEGRRTRALSGASASGWSIRAALVYAYPGR